MRITLTILLLTLMSLTVGAQKSDAPSDKVGFSEILLNKVGELNLNYKVNNSLISMRNGVNITIKGETPSENLNILADTILFRYASKEDTQPSVMELSGNIHIKSRIKDKDLIIKANKATINIAKQEAEFVEVTRVEHPTLGSPKKAATVFINLDTGDLLANIVQSLTTEADAHTAPKAP